MLLRLFLVLLVLGQTFPVSVLATRHCRSCDHAETTTGAKPHCPLRKAPSVHRCHEMPEAGGERIASPGCNCGDRAASAIRKGEPTLPTPLVETPPAHGTTPLVLAPADSPRSGVAAPPERPPRPAVL